MGFLRFPFGAMHPPDPWALFLRVRAIGAGTAKPDPLKLHKGCLCCVSQAMGRAPALLSSTPRAAPFPKGCGIPGRFLPEADSKTEMSMQELWGRALWNNTCEGARESGWGGRVKLHCPQRPVSSRRGSAAEVALIASPKNGRGRGRGRL